jgi:hypothetical protein
MGIEGARRDKKTARWRLRGRAQPFPVGSGQLQTFRLVVSALGHKRRKWCRARVMSVLPLKADIRQREWQSAITGYRNFQLTP